MSLDHEQGLLQLVLERLLGLDAVGECTVDFVDGFPFEVVAAEVVLEDPLRCENRVSD